MFAAASPLVTPVSFAAAPWDARLVVIILRGGMDGLDVMRPVGDRDFAALRPGFGAKEAAPVQLTDFWALHGGLSGLEPWWDAGELAFAHAVSTPYRDKRSHFDGQDLLEAGTNFDGGVISARDGWLNRMLQAVPGVSAETAYAVGRDDMLLLSGQAPVANWSPDTRLNLSPQAERLLELVSHDHPLYRDAIREALDLTDQLDAAEEIEIDSTEMGDMAEMVEDAKKRRGRGYQKIAEFTAGRLLAETRVAAFSITGWDTHRNQGPGMNRALQHLVDVLVTLKAGLGGVWSKTAVLAMTEFGRTARANGTQGTDHGTGGLMLMAGGALRGQQVFGQWPGLSESDLYDRRDLMPTRDVRAYAAGAMQELFGLDRAVLEGAVFPGLDMGGIERLVL